MSSKVVVIGLDGATFTLLKPWMEQGRLPFFKSLIERRHQQPSTLMYPSSHRTRLAMLHDRQESGKLGIAGFLQQKPQSYQEVAISATTCRARTFWHLLSEDGRRAAVLNVPYTAPPGQFNGVLIGGFDTPPSKMAEAVIHPVCYKRLKRNSVSIAST